MHQLCAHCSRRWWTVVWGMASPVGGGGGGGGEGGGWWSIGGGGCRALLLLCADCSRRWWAEAWELAAPVEGGGGGGGEGGGWKGLGGGGWRALLVGYQLEPGSSSVAAELWSNLVEWVDGLYGEVQAPGTRGSEALGGQGPVRVAGCIVGCGAIGGRGPEHSPPSYYLYRRY